MKHLERQSGKAIDLLICCGDFQVCFSWLLLLNCFSVWLKLLNDILRLSEI